MIEDLKRCCKCEMECLKSNFHKKKNLNDGLFNQCSSCRKRYYIENQEKTKKHYLHNPARIKDYELKIHDKINTRKKSYSNNKYKTDNIYCLFVKQEVDFV